MKPGARRWVPDEVLAVVVEFDPFADPMSETFAARNDEADTEVVDPGVPPALSLFPDEATDPGQHTLSGIIAIPRRPAR